MSQRYWDLLYVLTCIVGGIAACALFILAVFAASGLVAWWEERSNDD